MKSILLTLASLLFTFCTTPIFAQTITGPNNGFFGPDLVPGGGDQNLLAFRLKGFDNASGVNSAAYLGVNDLGVGFPNREETTINWTQNGSNPVSFTYDPAGPSIQLSVAGNTLNFDATRINASLADNVKNPNGLTLGDINYLYIGLRNRGGSDLAVNRLVINGEEIGDFSGNDIHFTSNDFCDFALATTPTTITFDLVLPNTPLGSNENSKVEFLFGSDAAAPICEAAPAEDIPLMSLPFVLLFSLILMSSSVLLIRRMRA